ncbi:hypothetical protein HanIR_Chr07g0338731 [Helianthus annuus]|nr:hypothetical protein HanIR_Chr07g0338731 [Helianthus annuus]
MCKNILLEKSTLCRLPRSPIHSVISPVNKLLRKFRSLHKESFCNELGRLPENEFSLKSIDLNNAHAPISSGTRPVNWFFLRLTSLRLYKPSISFGISPSKRLSETSSDLSPCKDQTLTGNIPEN